MFSAISAICFIVSFVAFRFMPLTLSIRFLAGTLVGCLLGLIPFFMFRGRDRPFAKQSVVYCGLSGLIGGALLAIPTVIVICIIGSRRMRRIEADLTRDLANATGSPCPEPPILP